MTQVNKFNFFNIRLKSILMFFMQSWNIGQKSGILVLNKVTMSNAYELGNLK